MLALLLPFQYARGILALVLQSTFKYSATRGAGGGRVQPSPFLLTSDVEKTLFNTTRTKPGGANYHDYPLAFKEKSIVLKIAILLASQPPPPPFIS